jgi:hypothetical protein
MINRSRAVEYLLEEEARDNLEHSVFLGHVTCRLSRARFSLRVGHAHMPSPQKWRNHRRVTKISPVAQPYTALR